jgi:molybdopterin molybdotransferase
MNLFLEVVPVEKAVSIIHDIATPLKTEAIPLDEAYNNVLAEDVVAQSDIPGFSRSVVDGYAVVAADTTGASESLPAILTNTGRVMMGEDVSLPVGQGECMYVPTGGILPAGADAMAMVEYCEQIGDEVLVHRALAPGENIIMRGEDFATGDPMFSQGKRLSPRDLGVLAAIGQQEVKIALKPKIGIISTGNELVPVFDIPGPGQVRDSNTYLCSAFVMERGGLPVSYGIGRDERYSLEAAIQTAVEECDVVLLSGGSSKDDRDMCASTIDKLGEVLVHGIAIAPGKPTIIGRVNNNPVIGLPGHPASAYVVLIALVGELICAMLGEERAETTRRAILTQHIPSAKGRLDFVRVAVSLGKATPVFGKSGLLNTLVKSSGIVKVPASREGLEAGEEVEVILW